MFHPCRGGVRGGKDQFTWESVKTDKDRECYLGHSVMAPVGRWQQGKDIHWYNAEDKAKQAKVISEEFLKAKELEEKALMAALGYKVVEKPAAQNNSQQAKIKQEYEEKTKTKKSDDDAADESKLKIKKEKHSPLKGPQIVDFDSTHELDEMLLKLVAKYGFDRVFDALADDEKSSKKHKKKHKKHHKSSKKSKRARDNSDSESENDEKKAKKSKSSKSSKKSSSKDNSSSQSSSSSSDSD